MRPFASPLKESNKPQTGAHHPQNEHTVNLFACPTQHPNVFLSGLKSVLPFPASHDMNYSCTIKQPMVRTITQSKTEYKRGFQYLQLKEPFAVEIEMMSYLLGPFHSCPGL